MNDLNAAEAETSGHGALLDVDGCVWLPVAGGWSYLSEHTTVTWDVHDRLPARYQPYRPLDAFATRVITAGLAGNHTTAGNHAVQKERERT